MPSATYSFLDIAVLDAVRQRFAAGDALVLLSTDLAEVIWANGPGAAMFGYADIEAAIGAPTHLGLVARRQVMATSGYPAIGNDRSVAVRIASGSGSQAVPFLASAVALPDGERAILLAAPNVAKQDFAQRARRAIAGFDEAGHFAALVDGTGGVVTAADGLERLGIAPETLAGLVSEVGPTDRLIKRLIPSARGRLPAGFARLTDEPALHLLVVVDDVQDADEGESADTERGEAEIEPSAAAGGDLGDGDAAAETGEAVDAENIGTADLDGEAKTPVEAPRRERWYFSPEPTPPASNVVEASEPAVPEPQEALAEIEEAEQVEEAEIAEPVFERALSPVRFVWRTDADGKFSAMSPEFASAVGAGSAEVVGQSFRDVATRLKLDPSGEIAGLLERRDTWSGRTVMWPVVDSALRVPVDLAALPVYGRERNFEGFRGFGVARGGDAVAVEDLEPAPPAAAETEPREVVSPAQDTTAAVSEESALSDDPFKGEVPVLEIVPKQERRYSDKVIRLAEHRTPVANDKGLSSIERNAFREIGDRLKKDTASTANDAVSETPSAQETAVEETVEVVSADISAVSDAGHIPMEAEASQVDENGLDTVRDAAAEGAQATVVEDAVSVPSEASVVKDSDAQAVGASDDAGDDEPDSVTDGELVGGIDESAEAEPVSLADDADGTEIDAIEAAVSDWTRNQDRLTSEPETAGQSEAASIETHEIDEQDGTEAPEPRRAAGFLPSAFTRPAEPALINDAATAEQETGDFAILSRLPVPVLIHAGDTLHFANEEFFELTGYETLEKLADSGGLEVLFGEPYPQDSEGDGERKLRLVTRDGTEIPVAARLQSVPWKSGKALLLALSRVEAVAEREMPAPALVVAATTPAPALAPVPMANTELENRVAEMRAIVDTATDGVVVLDKDGAIRSISRAAEALFGFDSADVMGKQFASLFAIESQRSARDYLAGLSEHGVASVLNDGLEVIGREAEGRFIPLFMTIGRLPNDSGYCAVVRDITQWKRAEEELTQARAQAERASSQKTDFLARVSHEIRTPLNAIIGFSELMIDEKFGKIGNDRYRDYLRDINRSGNHVLDLVNDLLDISKIEAGEQEMAYEAVSLNDTLSETVAMMQPQANRERVIIRSSFASQLPEVVADLRSVRQIALNLLSNAVRYTQAGGQVIVSTAYEPSGDIVMRVRDTGIGMSSAEIEQALKPFKQINALKRGRGEGTGLGLPLTKAMVEANRARFSILSTPGEGTLVEVTFPSTRVLAD